jgi:hypothetical protein
MIKISLGFLAAVLYFSSFQMMAQIVLEPYHEIVVSDGTKTYPTPWIGGLNSGQYNKADLNGDGLTELIIYDRSAQTYQIWQQSDGSFITANDLCVLLPDIPDGWVLFVDYDQDGKKDIFSNGSRGIVVFRNISTENEPVQWQKVADPLLTQGFTIKINLIANQADVPAITDIDNDGDIDILVYNFAIGGYIRYNKNLSMEKYGHADSLDFEISTRTWGEFEECECNLFAFNGQTCDDLDDGRVNHPGGKALLAFDADGDGDKDLLVGHEQCIELYFYENMGDLDSAYMTGYSSMFPNESKPANFHIFPAGYLEDLDFDGVKDLIVTPSFEDNYDFRIDFARSNWFYKNVNTNAQPEFEFQTASLMQQQGVDLGENSVPAFADINANGKLDLVVAANGYKNGDHYSGYVTHYSNTGTNSEPSFTHESADFMQLSTLNLMNPTVQFMDFDANGSPDIIYSGFVLQEMAPKSWLLLNQAGSGAAMLFNIEQKIAIALPDEVDPGDTPHFTDVDDDGNTDLLLGKANGALVYYRNKSDDTFELADESFLDIERDFSQERLSLSVSTGDIDGNGQTDLLVTDASGAGRIYFEYQDQINSTPISTELMYENTVSGKKELVKFDTRSWCVGADLFALGTESIIAGGIRGGLQFFKNNATGIGGNDPNSLQVRIYPNPVFESTVLTINANQDLTVELLTLLGQSIREPFDVRKFTSTNLDIQNLQNGPYILRSIAEGKSEAQLFMIQR